MRKHSILKNHKVRLIDGVIYFYKRGVITSKVELNKLNLRFDSLKDAFDSHKYNVFKRQPLDTDTLKFHHKITNRRDGYFLNELTTKRIDKLDDDKSPETTERHYGIEIEFVSSHSEHEIKKEFAKAGLHQFVTYHSDGSVHGGNSGDCDGSCRENCECAQCGETHFCDDLAEHTRRNRMYVDDVEWNDEDESCAGHSCMGYDDHPDYDCSCECDCTQDDGHEVCVLIPESKLESIVERVCSVLNDQLEASVNKTCGLHVHLDMRRRKASAAYKRLVNSQEVLRSLVPYTRRKNDYCKPNITSDLTEALANGARYWVVNPQSLKKHKTLEVRLHSGTTDATKIINWVKLLSHIAWVRSKDTTIQGFKQLIGEGLSIDVALYFAGRYQKFNSDGKPKLWTPVDLNNESRVNQSINEYESEAA